MEAEEMDGRDSYSQGRMSFASWPDMNEQISIVSTVGSDIGKHTQLLMHKHKYHTLCRIQSGPLGCQAHTFYDKSAHTHTQQQFLHFPLCNGKYQMYDSSALKITFPRW